jgi:hypothetical protein
MDEASPADRKADGRPACTNRRTWRSAGRRAWTSPTPCPTRTATPSSPSPSPLPLAGGAVRPAAQRPVPRRRTGPLRARRRVAARHPDAPTAGHDTAAARRARRRPPPGLRRPGRAHRPARPSPAPPTGWRRSPPQAPRCAPRTAATCSRARATRCPRSPRDLHVEPCWGTCPDADAARRRRPPHPARPAALHLNAS